MKNLNYLFFFKYLIKKTRKYYYKIVILDINHTFYFKLKENKNAIF